MSNIKLVITSFLSLIIVATTTVSSAPLVIRKNKFQQKISEVKRLTENLESEDKTNNADLKKSAETEGKQLKEDKNPPISNNEYFSQHDLCEYEIMKAEKKYGIPHKLLMAISTVESGCNVENGRKKRPYPWTVCAGGKGYFLSTKSAAIATVKKLMARGVRNIDVGCMQVNLLHHSKAFRNLEEAFTPKHNVAYASKFFMKLKKTYGSWTNAVGYYHSKNEKHYRPYCSLVYNEWKKVYNQPVNTSIKVQKASSKVHSKISFLPSYYSLADRKVSERLHQLSRMSLSRTSSKFFTKRSK